MDGSWVLQLRTEADEVAEEGKGKDPHSNIVEDVGSGGNRPAAAVIDGGTAVAVEEFASTDDDGSSGHLWCQGRPALPADQEDTGDRSIGMAAAGRCRLHGGIRLGHGPSLISKSGTKSKTRMWRNWTWWRTIPESKTPL